MRLIQSRVRRVPHRFGGVESGASRCHHLAQDRAVAAAVPGPPREVREDAERRLRQAEVPGREQGRSGASGASSQRINFAFKRLVIISLCFSCFETGEGVAQPTDPVPQRHRRLLCWKPATVGTDTQAVPHQVENARWRQSILAGRALISPLHSSSPALPLPFTLRVVNLCVTQRPPQSVFFTLCPIIGQALLYRLTDLWNTNCCSKLIWKLKMAFFCQRMNVVSQQGRRVALQGSYRVKATCTSLSSAA